MRNLQPAQHLRTRLRKLEVLLEKIRARGETLAGERRRYLELCTMSPEASLITDENGRIREANPAARKLLGASCGILSRRVLFTFIEYSHRSALRQLLAEAVLDHMEGKRERDATILSRDGRRFAARLFLYASRPAEAEERGFYWKIHAISFPFLEEAA